MILREDFNLDGVEDFNLDGVEDSKDANLVNVGQTLGWNALSRANGTTGAYNGSRKGYAGYESSFFDHSTMHVRHRVYLAEMGRWSRRDPIGFQGGMNVYAYSNNTPIRDVDPSGLRTGYVPNLSECYGTCEICCRFWHNFTPQRIPACLAWCWQEKGAIPEINPGGPPRPAPEPEPEEEDPPAPPKPWKDDLWDPNGPIPPEYQDDFDTLNAFFCWNFPHLCWDNRLKDFYDPRMGGGGLGGGCAELARAIGLGENAVLGCCDGRVPPARQLGCLWAAWVFKNRRPFRIW